MAEGPQRSFPSSAETDFSRASLLFIGNATLLLRCCGFTILTDPNFIHAHEKVAIGYGLHAERLTNPALEIADLPPLDFVLLSHFHGDHFDQIAERELAKDLPILTPPAAADELSKRGFHQAMKLPPWSTATFTKGEATLEVTAAPGWHGPGPVGAVMPQVMGSVLHFMGRSGETRLRMYITGDTLVIDDLRDVPKRLGDIDLAVLHLGGTRVFGVTVTMNGEQGVRLMRMIRPEITIPVHFDDYDVFRSPLLDFEAAVTKARLDDHVRIMKRGESLVFALPVAGPDLPSAERGDGVTYLSDSRTGKRADSQNERRSA